MGLPVFTTTKQGLVCLAQGNKTVPSVRLEPENFRSRVRQSTTEPLPSPKNYSYIVVFVCYYLIIDQNVGFCSPCFTTFHFSRI